MHAYMDFRRTKTAAKITDKKIFAKYDKPKEPKKLTE
jgi:hypothetical protein